MSSLLAAFDWLLDNAALENIRVVNLSLGKAVEVQGSNDPLVIAAEALVDQGIVVVASAGNYGDLGNFYVTSPGNAPNVITVGALDNADTGCMDDDQVADFSSRGPTLYDHYIKPDLVAPGFRVVAPISDRANFKTVLPERIESCSTTSCYG